MRRIFRNSTAIALGLSLGLPQLASAQTLAAADAARIAADRAQNMPDLAGTLADEVKAGVTEADLKCLMNAPKPCAEGSALFTPEGVAVQMVDDGSFILAPAPQQIMRVDGDGNLVPINPERMYGAPEAAAAGAAGSVVVAQADAAAAADAGGPVVVPAQPSPDSADQPDDAATAATADAEAAARAAAAAADAADSARAAAKVAAESPEPAQVEAAPVVEAARAEATPAEAAPAQAPSDIARALAERDAAKPAAAPVVTPAPAPADAPAPVAPAPAASAPVVVTAPQAEPAAAPQVTDAAPVVVTPPTAAQQATARVPQDDALAEALAAAKAIPEATAKATDAAREAAAAATAPVAAALAESSAPVVTSEKTAVTEANSRAATEDFATDLRGQARAADAAAAAAAEAAANAAGQTVGVTPAPGAAPVVTGTQTAETGKNRDSDLETALKQAILPALAGMAVGQMLSNDREVALNTGDRVVVTRADGSQEIIKDDNALLLRPGSTVQTEEYADGSSRTIVTREDGSQVITIRDADLRILRRTVVHPDGTSTALIDETAAVQPVDVAQLPAPAEPVVVMPGQAISDEALREALRRETAVNRSFTLGQVRSIPEVRALVAPVDIQAITFDTGSAAIKPDQAQALASLGRVIADQVRQNPGEVFLIEGHTDSVGSDVTNLALSDRRAESVALALTEYFRVPPENLVVQGYGERYLKIAAQGDIRENRRAAVRRITDLLARN